MAGTALVLAVWVGLDPVMADFFETAVAEGGDSSRTDTWLATALGERLRRLGNRLWHICLRRAYFTHNSRVDGTRLHACAQ